MQKRITTNITIISCLGLLFYSCSTTKKVPKGEYSFTGNKFIYDKEETDIKKKIKIIDKDLSDYVRQKPAGKFLGFFPLWQWVYNLSPEKFDTTFQEYYRIDASQRNQKLLDSLLTKNKLDQYVGKSLWLQRFYYNQGEAPVLLDEKQSEFSAKNLNRLFHDKGYFDSKVNVSYKKDSISKKAETLYNIKLGDPSYIENFTQNISDAKIEEYLNSPMVNQPLIHSGDQYTFGKFEEERDRVVDVLKNRGYYDFNDSGEDLYFEADTTKSDKRLDITMFIDKYIQDSIKKDSVVPFTQYRFGKINIYADSRGQADDETKLIKEEYDDYNIFFTEKPKYKPRYFTDAFVIRPGGLYRQRQEIQTKRNIFKKDNINLHSFKITKQDSILNVDVFFTQKKKYDLNLFVESYASRYMNFAISPGVTLTSRNLFKGGENLETTLKSTLGSVNKDFSLNSYFLNAYEISLETKLKFPYLLTPINLDRILPKRFSAESAIRTNISTQKNVGLDKTTYGFGFDMDISSAEFQHKVSLFNTEFINNGKRDRYYDIFTKDNQTKNLVKDLYYQFDPNAPHYATDDELTDAIIANKLFQNSLSGENAKLFVDFENMLYRKANISQNVVINSFIYQFTYNQENSFRPKNNPWFVQTRIELAGNLLHALDKAFGFAHSEDASGKKVGNIFGIPYSQFVKIDLDVRRKFKIDSHSSFAARFLFGIVQPYGNSDVAPFVRSYSAGGANDVRGWAPLTLGPGSKPRINSNTQSLEFDNLKLLFNTEYRFNMFGSLEGAYFIDAGNIWGTDPKRQETLFKFKKFYKEFGIGSGVGFRYHIGTFAIVRFDFGYKIYDPSYEEGKRWQFDNFNILKPRLHFGINYPF
ncbi:BamA/TamA family outer membrane protein [Chishuiella sp.]|uniref:translocation and assembly module lipoprotein TamL n=1 Tax=Chishuiella sp. TaxID=1969467 RepID=UPI0028A5EFBB|nr:BamA/TamA family outer membrane protein [Chishuiella sp.]